MKKKLLCLLLATAMTVTVFAGCGEEAASDEEDIVSEENEEDDDDKDDDDKEDDDKDDDDKKIDLNWLQNKFELDSDGEVLNIFCWNYEFKERVEWHYPGYEMIDNTTGMIGDVVVKWQVYPLEDNIYENELDRRLENQENANDDDKIDIFLVDMTNASKYVNSEYSVDIERLGITDSDLAEQYQYTKDYVTDFEGTLKGVSWQAFPGAMYYNKEACKDIWGTDDPAEIQKKVMDWDTFNASAAEAAAKGYKMTATSEDTYRVYAGNVSNPWVVDGKLVIDENIAKWVNNSKVMCDAGYTTAASFWFSEWSEGLWPEGKTVCYFGPAWLLNYSMRAETSGSIASCAGWDIAEGPQSFFWGGTWICAAEGTDNADLVKDIMLKLTTDKDVMKGMVTRDDDFVNNKSVMNEMAESSLYSSAILGNINPLKTYCAGAEKIKISKITRYENTCNELFMAAMQRYFKDEATYEEALEEFYENIIERYPELIIE